MAQVEQRSDSFADGELYRICTTATIQFLYTSVSIYSMYDAELDKDSAESVIRLYLSKLAEATLDPVWLANELSSEGLLNTQARVDLLSIDGVSAYDKAVKLWNRIEVIIKVHENPRQALLTVCNVMKQRAELASLAQAMTLQLMPHGKNLSYHHLTQH